MRSARQQSPRLPDPGRPVLHVDRAGRFAAAHPIAVALAGAGAIIGLALLPLEGLRHAGHGPEPFVIGAAEAAKAPASLARCLRPAGDDGSRGLKEECCRPRPGDADDPGTARARK